ncbi:OmpA family protein [Fulvivirga sedimenti]|uniref:OmpA family protein n=1 Tax=Fulvivirga sedimenti TaxID=2879465 RepID=A0A9X1HS92_9BACT|nr:OmpA family protein [Fulvivirga sedimenti]MCA6075464.1 OmpA family protein [Fulvivirga sedimenti]MCA6076641.1 OmpA family protein [Fulvivirga sedimenti]MCA6077769.1 OmpA family protein [Fulvivirga sedimenti]
MLRITTFTRVVMIFMASLITITGNSVPDRDPDPIPGNSNYVVIGAFAFIRNAERFTKYAQEEKDFDAKFAINPLRNLYYVYMYSSDERKDAVDVVLKVRADHPDLWDAWVFSGSLGALDEGEMVTPVLSESNEPQEYTEAENAEWEAMMSEREAVVEQAQEEMAPVNEALAVSAEVEETPVVEPEKPANLEPKEGYYYLYFNTINKKTMKEVKGRVRVIDAERFKELEIVESQELIELKDPNNGTNRLKAATQIFGFKEVDHVINLDQPLTDSTASFVKVVGDSIIMDFELERFKKGDILVMYNVYFFKDAAVMKPESKYELLSLLDMLEENDKLKVRIHGHTNGNAKGKIIHLDDEEKNFFSLRADQEEDFGSAKALSTYRAETIQDWLISEGIPADRMSIKGWGGKKMIYDKHDTQAHKNVRVEIEIVED